MARGRKAQAALSVAQVTELKQIAKPPKHLTTTQSDIWRVVMASSAGDYIQAEAYPVLVEYCRAVENADRIAKEIEEFDFSWSREDDGLKRLDKMLQMHDRIQGKIAALSVKLRLTPSTRVHPETAGTSERHASKRKPWQFDGEQ